MVDKDDWNESDLVSAIYKRWPYDDKRNRFVVSVQVNDRAGFARRRLDAVVLDTWPSKGLELHGLEIKVTRQDLRRELQDLSKFEEMAKSLDRFSIVAAPKVATLDMLPDKWGLYIPDGRGGLRARRKPLQLWNERNDGVVSRSFMAAFVRALLSRSTDDEALRAEYKRGYDRGKLEGSREVDRVENREQRLRLRIEEFEEASGIDIDSYKAERIGQAVDLILSGGLGRKLRFSSGIREKGEALVALADDLAELKEQFDEDLETNPLYQT